MTSTPSTPSISAHWFGDSDEARANAALDALFQHGTPMDAASVAYFASAKHEPVEPAPLKRKRKPSIKTLIRRAEKVGKPVTGITTGDVTLHFGAPSTDADDDAAHAAAVAAARKDWQ